MVKSFREMGKIPMIEVKKGIFYHAGFDRFYKRFGGTKDLGEYYLLIHDKKLRKLMKVV